MPTCPACGLQFVHESQKRAHAKHAKTPHRKRYLVDYARGKRHRAAGKAPEEDPPQGYRAGYGVT